MFKKLALALMIFGLLLAPVFALELDQNSDGIIDDQFLPVIPSLDPSRGDMIAVFGPDDAHKSYVVSGNIDPITGALLAIPNTQTFTQCVTVKDPVAASDHHAYRTPVAITITHMHCLATGGTNLVGQFQECDANGANCANVDSDMTCTAGSTSMTTAA